MGTSIGAACPGSRGIRYYLPRWQGSAQSNHGMPSGRLYGGGIRVGIGTREFFWPYTNIFESIKPPAI